MSEHSSVLQSPMEKNYAEMPPSNNISLKTSGVVPQKCLIFCSLGTLLPLSSPHTSCSPVVWADMLTRDCLRPVTVARQISSNSIYSTTFPTAIVKPH